MRPLFRGRRAFPGIVPVRPFRVEASRAAPGGPRLLRALRGFEEDRRWRRRFSPREANFGIGEPGFTQDGHFRWSIWNWMPRFLEPIAVRSGAPRFDDPLPAYVWQAVQPETAKSFAPGCRRRQILALHPVRHVEDHLGRKCLLGGRALPRQDAHRDDGQDGRDHGDRTPRDPPLHPSVENGRASRSTSRMFGMPTVPRKTESGHLKIRRR